MIQAADLEGFDALILLIPRIEPESFPSDGRLAIIARFGVGYDTVNVKACTDHGCALVITPDGVRRPVAVSIITFMLALTGKLIAEGPADPAAGREGWAERNEHMGVGLVGRTLGSLGIGNIGAEVFRLAKPFEMKLHRARPLRRPEGRERARRSPGRARGAVPRGGRALGQLSAQRRDPPHRQRRAARPDEARGPT